MPESLKKPLVIETDAVVIGAGLSGIAAAIHLARSGFRVTCIEQRKEIDKSLVNRSTGLPRSCLRTSVCPWKS